MHQWEGGQLSFSPLYILEYYSAVKKEQVLVHKSTQYESQNISYFFFNQYKV